MPSLKLRTFDGSRNPGVYRDWKRESMTTQMNYDLMNEQLAPLVYLALESGEGKPRELLDDIDVADLKSDITLKKIWQRLDAEFEPPLYEQSDEVLKRFERTRRAYGQSMADYLSTLRNNKRAVERLDPGTQYSDVSFAHKILRGAGLRREEQRQVLAACGAQWDAERISSALRMLFPEVQNDDKFRP